jgi:hypothetical protein
VFDLEEIDPQRFCDRVGEQDVVFCEDFDDPTANDETQVFRSFVRIDPPEGNLRYSVENAVVHSHPRAVRLDITGGGSPDARLSRTLVANDRLVVSFWLHLAVIDTNVIVVSELYLTNSRVLRLLTNGVIREQSTNNEIVAQVSSLPSGRWFEVMFDLDLNGPSGMVSVDGETQPLMLKPVTIPEDSRSLVLGPAEPLAPNTALGWSVLLDDVLVR